MKKTITPEEALKELYGATRVAPLPADAHVFLGECAKTLTEFLSQQLASSEVIEAGTLPKEKTNEKVEEKV